ncbi:MAG TPA: DoxX family protein [Chloroflexota bacterium]|nr:DoxX family protein [Chloroflexota bacterium]
MRWLDWGPKIPMEYLALIRITLGLCFLTNVVNQIGQGYLTSGEPLTRYLEGLLREPFTDPLYRSFLQGVVLPNAALFAQLVVWGELAVGVLLVLGLATRLAAAGAVFLGLNYWLAVGILSTPALQRSFLMIDLVVLLAVPGVVWGLDRLLLGRAPAWLIGRPEQLPREQLHATGPIAWLGLSGFATQLNYLALLRMMIGFSWLVAGTTKLVFLNVLGDPRFITSTFQRYANQGRDMLAQGWLDFVLANYSVFAPLIILGELTAGLLLFLGLFTRLGAAVGIWLNLNYMWMKGWLANDAYLDRGWLVCQLVLFLAGAGLAAGLDGLLYKHLPRWLTGASPAAIAAREAMAPPRKRLAGA